MGCKVIPVNESIPKYDVRVKTYHMNDKYKDIVATFPKLVSRMSENPNDLDNVKVQKETYWNELEQDHKMQLNMERSIQRTKTKVKRYVIHRNMKYMWTLTFAKKYTSVTSSKGVKTYDVGKIADAWTMWKSFIKRCSRVGIKFDYIVTMEVQEERLAKYGEKVFHFHFATNMNLPIDQKKAKMRGFKAGMLQLWTHGQINVQKQKSKKKFANVYLMKYITKMFDESAKGSQRYRCSQNMEIPTTQEFFKTEKDLDMYVTRYANHNDLRVFKTYFPICDGHNEVLFYSLTPI